MADLLVRPITSADADLVTRLLVRSWGSTAVVGHGRAYDASTLPGVLAERDGDPVGLLTYEIGGIGMEIVTIDAFVRHEGVGTALLDTAAGIAREAGVRRIWLVTTNDNRDAVRFYQRRGMRIVNVAPGAVDRVRTIKPSIPEVGAYGIPLHDELTLELALPT